MERFVPTQLGAAVLASSLGPDEGLKVFAELQRARQCFVLENELHIIYLVINPMYTLDTHNWVIWQTVKTLIKCHKMWHFIRVCTV